MSEPTPETPTVTPLWPQGWSYDAATGLASVSGTVAPDPLDPDPMAAMMRPRATFVLTFAADLALTPPMAPEQHDPQEG